MPRKTKAAQQGKRVARSERAVVDPLAEMVQREVRAKLGANSTFEQRRDAAAELMREVFGKDSDADIGERVTDSKTDRA